ncbi:TetR family transcriptional regulator [Pseudohalioglobus sediminis]|uniref:TetR family transcriptional regulator n=1 Tax=Pseudohalioglobus sediminis TaxID=2606449 RepID=A0A5B0X283_9GAMM|nr:TetR family transcriptional regulator [Pseudohalioglobus sediminis]KAA1193460.1 TetR family transcriptional regulator [Pseudohalioglobus sediminis]
MSTSRAAQADSRTRRAKGERTRNRILQAVFNVIANEGLRGVTHRAIAREAGVQLSLTTYYFKDIESLIGEAFEQFSEHMRPDIEQLWQRIFTRLDAYNGAQLRKREVRETLAGYLAGEASDYILAQVREKPVGLAVEQIFFTQARLSPELRARVEAHRARLLAPLVDLCSRFNRHDPEIDAELLLDTITSMEYQALGIPVDQVNDEHVQRLMRRHVGWILGLQRF